MGRKSNIVYCPKCRQIGSLRFKDSKSNKLVVTHYSKQLYKKGKCGTYFHYIGVLNDKTFKILTELWLDLGKVNYQNTSRLKEEFRFRGMLLELREILRSKKIPVDRSDLVDYNVSLITDTVNRLYDIHQLKLQESSKNSYTFLRKCPCCNEGIMIKCDLMGKLFGGKANFKVIAFS